MYTSTVSNHTHTTQTTGRTSSTDATADAFARLLKAQTSSTIVQTTSAPPAAETTEATTRNLLDTEDLLLPTAETIQALTNEASSQLKTLLAEAGIPAPASISYDQEGQMVLPDDYAYADEFKALLKDNPDVEKKLHDVNALTSHYIGIQQALAFQEEYGQANSDAERAAIVNKYSFLFGENRHHASTRLTFSESGDITIQADGKNVFNSMADEATTSSPPAPQTVIINGVKVEVSGHSLDEMEGRSLLRTLKTSLADYNAFAEQQKADPNNTYIDGIRHVDGEAVMTVEETVELAPRPEGAISTYMDVSFMSPAGNLYGLDLEYASVDVNAYRERLSKLLNFIDTERQLKEEYGEDIKLIYSHQDEGYIMLTPDDARYNEMKSAEEGIYSVLNDIRTGIISPDDVKDLLAPYGYTV